MRPFPHDGQDRILTIPDMTTFAKPNQRKILASRQLEIAKAIEIRRVAQPAFCLLTHRAAAKRPRKDPSLPSRVCAVIRVPEVPFGDGAVC
jgi:hypothetical protein